MIIFVFALVYIRRDEASILFLSNVRGQVVACGRAETSILVLGCCVVLWFLTIFGGNCFAHHSPHEILILLTPLLCIALIFALLFVLTRANS